MPYVNDPVFIIQFMPMRNNLKFHALFRLPGILKVLPYCFERICLKLRMLHHSLESFNLLFNFLPLWSYTDFHPFRTILAIFRNDIFQR
jgi:hypothetical protein